MEGYYFDHALLISCIDGLGRFDDRLGVYEKELDTVNCLKDIDRFLRRDFEDTKQALLTMGKCNVVSQNLLPLLKTYPSDQDVLYHTMRVLVLMSMPPQDIYPNNIKDIHHSIKAEFTKSDALGILMSMCHEPLSHFEDLSDAHYKTLQMFITFVRNMMIVPDSEEWGNTSSRNQYSTLQVDFLKIAFQENVLELVGLIAQHMGTKTLKADAPAMLDLLHAIFSAFDPRSVLDADESVLLSRIKAQSAMAEDLRNSDIAPSTLSGKREKPVHASIQHIQLCKPQVRHHPSNPGSRLLGHSGENAFYIKTVPGTLGQVVLKNAARTKAATKVQATVNALSQPVPKTTNVVLLASVKVYTSQLLRGAFNALMSVARDEAALGLNVCSLTGKSMLRFFELSAWFMQYCRYQEEARAKDRSKTAHENASSSATSLYQSTSSILSWKMIHAVLRVWLEMIDTDGKVKKETDWRLQEASIKVLKESLSLLDLAFHYGSEQDSKAADMLQRRLLQDDTKESGVLNRITQCMRQFKKHDKRIARQEGRETRAYAVDMVKTMHIVLRVYTRLCKENFSAARNTTYKMKRDDMSEPQALPSREIEGGSIAACEAEVDGALPESDGIGAGLVDQDDNKGTGAHDCEKHDCAGQVRSSGAHQQADDCLEETIGASVLHLRVDFAGVLKAVSHIEILKLYMFLLQKYKALDAATLHAIAAYLGRLCNELRLEPMMYQISYLRQFHIILSDESIKKRPMYNSLRKVASRIASHLVARLDPEPVSLPEASGADGRDLNQLNGESYGEVFARPAVNDGVLGCLPAQTTQDTLTKIQDRVTKLLFVELLFEKGPRESEMIQTEYSWRKALLDQSEGRQDGHQIADDQDNDANVASDHPAQDQAAADSGSSDDEDALPRPGAAKIAPHRPAQGLAAGLQMTAEEQLRFKALFETVNGSRSVKQLLLAEWNQHEELQMTKKQVINTMAALQLRAGELTNAQEEKLELLVREFGHLGRRAYTRISNAFAGGFSPAAIKKHVTRLKLELPISSKHNRHNLEDLEGLHDANDDMIRAGPLKNTKERKRGHRRNRSPDVDVGDERDSNGSSGDDDIAKLPAAKKRRSSVPDPDGEGDSRSMEKRVSHEEEACSDVPGMSALEDDDVAGEGSVRATALISSDDDGVEHAPAAARRQRKEEEANKRWKKPGAVASRGVTPKGAEKVEKVQRKSPKSNSACPRNRTSEVPPSGKACKTSELPGAVPVSLFDIHAVTTAAHCIKDALKAESIGHMSAADIVEVLGRILVNSTKEQRSQDSGTVHVRISPKNDAEEHLMALPATAALLGVLGLHISGVNDPSVWDFDGSVMDLNDKLLSLTENSGKVAEDRGCHAIGLSEQCIDEAIVRTTAHASLVAEHLLDDDDDADEHNAAGRPLYAVTSARPKKQRRALLLDDEDDDDNDDRRIAGTDHQLQGRMSDSPGNGNAHCCVPPVPAQTLHDIANVPSVPEPGLGDLVPRPAAVRKHTASGFEGRVIDPACPAVPQFEYRAATAARRICVDALQLAAGQGETAKVFMADAPSPSIVPGICGSVPETSAQCAADASPISSRVDVSNLQGPRCQSAAEPLAKSHAVQQKACEPQANAVDPAAAIMSSCPGEEFSDTRARGALQPGLSEEDLQDSQPVGVSTVANPEEMPEGSGVAEREELWAQEGGLNDGHTEVSDDLSPHLWPTAAGERSIGDVDMMTPVTNLSHPGLLQTRSATRSVTFSDVTTDLVAGPTHEWQGSRQRRADGVEYGTTGVSRLPRPALKPQCRGAGAEYCTLGDSPPALAGDGSVADKPPSFEIPQEDEAILTVTGSTEVGRVPLSPIKVNTPRRGGTALSSKPLSSSALTMPGSQCKRPRTKKARLEAMRASQDGSRNSAAPCLPCSGEEGAEHPGTCTKQGSESNVPHTGTAGAL